MFVPTCSLSFLCIWDSIILLLCSLPVSNHSVVAVPLSLIALWVSLAFLYSWCPLSLQECAEEPPDSLPTAFPPSLSHAHYSCWTAVRIGSVCPPPLPFGRCGCPKAWPLHQPGGVETVLILTETMKMRYESGQWVNCFWEGRESMSSITSLVICFMTLFLHFQYIVVKNSNPSIKHFGFSNFEMNFW